MFPCKRSAVRRMRVKILVAQKFGESKKKGKGMGRGARECLHANPTVMLVMQAIQSAVGFWFYKTLKKSITMSLMLNSGQCFSSLANKKHIIFWISKWKEITQKST